MLQVAAGWPCSQELHSLVAVCDELHVRLVVTMQPGMSPEKQESQTHERYDDQADESRGWEGRTQDVCLRRHAHRIISRQDDRCRLTRDREVFDVRTGELDLRPSL